MPETSLPRWSQEQLDEDRARALALLVEQWGARGTQEYQALFNECLHAVDNLFQVTHDLSAFSGDVFSRHPDLVEPARFLGGPPVSQDDLETLAGVRISRLRTQSDLSQRIAAVIRAAWDPFRFPWLARRGGPTEEERRSALNWTASIWAIERVRTRRRTSESRQQEQVVCDVLTDSGFEEQGGLRRISQVEDLPHGKFTREAVIAGAKCDIAVRLRDSRLLAIECKASNSALNSVKRLVREAGGKALTWRGRFGDEVVPAVVLSGVYKLNNLVEAQNQYRLAILWQHQLAPLSDFVQAAR